MFNDVDGKLVGKYDTSFMDSMCFGGFCFLFNLMTWGFGWFLRAKTGGTCQTSLFSPTKKTTARIMMNVGNPETAFAFGQLPNEGIGLARLEFAFWSNFDTGEGGFHNRSTAKNRGSSKSHPCW